MLGGVDDPADLAARSAAYFETHPNGAAGNGSQLVVVGDPDVAEAYGFEELAADLRS